MGRAAAEALGLWDQFRRLEDAGAFAVECELIPANVLAEIGRRTGMVTISLGSGPNANVIFLFTSDICGEGRVPRHARAYADLASLHATIAAKRVRALTAYRADVAGGRFPGQAEIVMADATELELFVAALDA